jgi:hypothetical protein
VLLQALQEKEGCSNSSSSSRRLVGVRGRIRQGSADLPADLHDWRGTCLTQVCVLQGVTDPCSAVTAVYTCSQHTPRTPAANIDA